MSAKRSRPSGNPRPEGRPAPAERLAEQPTRPVGWSPSAWRRTGAAHEPLQR